MSTPTKQRGLLIAGNWKMNSGKKESESFFKALSSGLKFPLPSSVNALIFPPFFSIEVSKNFADPLGIEIGSQNAHWETKGAFTGEVSGPMVQELGLKWILIGHSERRQFFGETNETCKKRVHSLLKQGFKVLYCLGESRAEREAGLTPVVLLQQLSSVLPAGDAFIQQSLLNQTLSIAYEPVWAIGTGLTASPEQAEEAHQMIRTYLLDTFGWEAAGKTRVLYGGSVTPENARGLMEKPNIDGALIGGASLKPESFGAVLGAAISITSS